MTYQDWVVVGVDGSPTGEAALRYGLAEADRRGTGLRIIHVVPDLAPVAGIYPIVHKSPFPEAQRVGRRILDDAAAHARRHLDPDRVSLSLMSGSRVDCLLSVARQASLIVLGDQRRPALERLVTGSVLAGVAARSAAPVLAVPENWTSSTRRRTLVAAVKDCDHSEALVREAMEIAMAQKARLVLLHAWELPAVYDDIIASRVDAELWKDQVEQRLHSVVDGQRRHFPGLEVDFRVQHGQPAQIVVAASQNADLLLIARRPHGFPFGHLGGVGRAVLRESLCPVEVLPAVSEHNDLADFVLEEHGAFEKEAEGVMDQGPSMRSRKTVGRPATPA